MIFIPAVARKVDVSFVVIILQLVCKLCFIVRKLPSPLREINESLDEQNAVATVKGAFHAFVQGGLSLTQILAHTEHKAFSS